MRVKEETEKAGLKLKKEKTKQNNQQDHGIYFHHFMENRRGKVEAVTIFTFLGSKITADCDCTCEIQIHLFL